MNTRFPIMKSVVALTVALGMAAALNPSRAADGDLDRWFATKQREQIAVLETKALAKVQAVGFKAIAAALSTLPRPKFQ
jgi:hypothetical protein